MKAVKNVLFLLVDCLRSDACWASNRTAKTPSIDALRRRGTFFPNAIATTTTTTPSVASILTGTYPFVHGVRSLTGYGLNPKCKTLPEILKANGYHTYAEVSEPLYPQTGLDRGFDRYHCREEKEHVYSRWGQSLLDRFKNNEFEEPWFLFLHLFELHIPRKVQKRFNRDEFGKNRYDRALSSLDAYLNKLLKRVDQENTIVVLNSDHGERFSQSTFEGWLTELKSFILLRLKWRLGLRDRFGFRAVGHGDNVYDYLAKIPLIFVGEDTFPEGKTITNQVRQVDVFPTLVEALELTTLEDVSIHGRSLMPLIRGEEVDELPAYIEACGAILPDESKWLAAIRTAKYKFVYAPYSDYVPDQLYDLEEDPEEKINIIKKKPGVARELKEKLIALRSEEEGGFKLPGTKMSGEEEEELKERLRRLGYLG